MVVLEPSEVLRELRYYEFAIVTDWGSNTVAMSKVREKKAHDSRPLSTVCAAFVEHNTFLKNFLARFFSEQQDIEDVAQEAFLRAFVAEQQKEIDQPKAYLFRIAKNIALTKLTRKSNQITDYIEESTPLGLAGTTPSADDEAEAQEALGLYCEAVAALPEKCRQVYLFRKVHGLSHREIADRMSLSVSSVEKYLLQGILRCRAFVDEREGERQFNKAGKLPGGDRRGKGLKGRS